MGDRPCPLRHDMRAGEPWKAVANGASDGVLLALPGRLHAGTLLAYSLLAGWIIFLQGIKHFQLHKNNTRVWGNCGSLWH